jgi:spore maturation protein SpmA
MVLFEFYYYLQPYNPIKMALSRIWSAFIIIAVVVAGVRCVFLGDTDIFSWMVIGKASDPANPLKIDGIIETCWVSVEICLRLIGILTLFIGFHEYC